MNTCEWAKQDRLVHCHHTGEPHDHSPHSPNLSRSTREALFRMIMLENVAWVLIAVCDCMSLSSFTKVCVFEQYHPHHKQVRPFLFIWEGSESHKPPCRSVCCCLSQPSFKYVWHLCSPYKWLLAVFPTSKIKVEASETTPMASQCAHLFGCVTCLWLFWMENRLLAECKKKTNRKQILGRVATMFICIEYFKLQN